VKVAFCGAGHPHVFPRLALLCGRDDVEVTGIHEPVAEVRRRIAGQYEISELGSVEELVETRPDLVIVEGFDHENPEYVPALAQAGCDLLIEKPGAPGPEQMRAMADEVVRAGVHAQIGYMLRHSPVIPRLKAIVDEGVLGEITLARFHASSPVGCAAEIWQSLPDDIGGVTYTDGCHMMDLILHLLGAPRSVQGLVKRLPRGRTAVGHQFKPDVLSGLGGDQTFELGALVHEDVSGAILDYDDKVAVFDVTGWEAHGWVEEWRIELYGTRGTLSAGVLPPWMRLYLNEPVGDRDAGWHEFRTTGAPDSAALTLVPDMTYQAEMDDLLARLQRGERDQAGLLHGLAVVETLDAIFRSAADDGRRVAP
jgi:predicted dehydrogenase